MPKSTKKSVKKLRKIYLDYASSALFTSANPGAIHEFGLREKKKLEDARAIIADILHARHDEIIFTSGATESNNLAILGLVQNFSKPHIVTTNIEHTSILEVCKHLEKIKKAEVTYVEVEANGIINPQKIKKALRPNTVLVSVMYANNEIGTVQPIAEIGKVIRHFRKRSDLQNSKRSDFGVRLPFFHTDAVQGINYLPINALKLGVDLMSLNAAKIYGPKGVGALYVKKNTPLRQIMFGGGQEKGLRPGTENVASAMALAEALKITEKIKEKEVKRLTQLRDYFIKKLTNLNFGLVINGDLKERLPNNINITVPKIPSDLLVIELSARGIMISAKSACKSGDNKASHVIRAINPKAPEEDGSLRFSLGRKTSKQDIDYTLESLVEVLTKLKKWYNL
ncbi:MAG: cysteine desulfurase family protein [Patescibacteria group bacterium]